MPELQVVDNAGRSRFELLEDDELVGTADYVRSNTSLTLPHTVIVADRRGEGLGAVLVRGALEAARRDGLRVIPRCWYVEEFLETHPEYADLTPSNGHRGR